VGFYLGELAHEPGSRSRAPRTLWSGRREGFSRFSETDLLKIIRTSRAGTSGWDTCNPIRARSATPAVLIDHGLEVGPALEQVKSEPSRSAAGQPPHDVSH